MDRQQENAQARYLKRGFGWKRFSNISEGSDEEKRMLKSIIHDYPDLKNYCRFFETKRRSIIVMAELEGEDTTFLNTEKLQELLALPMNEDDKRKLYAYFDAAPRSWHWSWAWKDCRMDDIRRSFKTSILSG